MSYCKLVSGQYKQISDVRRVINYISEMDKSHWLVGGGNGIINSEYIHSSPDFIAEQFLFVQGLKKCRGRRLYHVVVSFDTILDEMSIAEIKNIAEKIIALYSQYQSVYALHENTRNLHLHIIFNNISLMVNKNLSYFFNIYDIKQCTEESIDFFRAKKKY